MRVCMRLGTDDAVVPSPARPICGRGMVLGLVVAFFLAGSLEADVVYLKGGGKVVGKVVSTAGGSIRVRTVAGTLGFPASEALRIEYGPTPEEDYAQRAAAVDRKDPAALMALADWCAGQGLSGQQEELLRAVLALEPDHAEARRRLGYVRVGSAWLTRDEAMRAKGLVQYRGRWVTPADRARLEREDLEDALQRRWGRVIRSAVQRLEMDNRDARRQAWIDLDGIKDPLAIAPLVAAIGRTEKTSVRVTLVGVLARFAEPPARDDRALDALVDIALLDDAPDVRRAAVAGLVAAEDPRVTAEFVRALNEDSWTLKLRASYTLGELRAFEAVPDLIRNLTIIEGYRREISWSWRGGGFSHGAVTTYVPGYRRRALQGGVVVIEPVVERLQTGVSLGSGAPRERRAVVRRRPVRSQNTEAWGALVKISGRDFGYYESQWRAWYDQERLARRRARQKRNEDKD